MLCHRFIEPHLTLAVVAFTPALALVTALAAVIAVVLARPPNLVALTPTLTPALRSCFLRA